MLRIKELSRSGFSWPAYCTVSALSGPAYLEIKWSCCGEAVARLQGLCVAATAVCAGGADHLIFVIMMN